MGVNVTFREPLLILPGFMPGAVGFAVRLTTALLLAYLIAFAIQLDTASSAGLCVAIVAQATPGMTLSKATYRAIGTLVGGVVGVAFVAMVPQDRTMLLAAFALWLGACTFVASVLRDFRSYGAVLCGYTVGIIAVGSIDAPSGVMLAALNRVAAILIGIASVAVVNLLLAGPAAYERLVTSLQQRLSDAEGLALSALRGEPLPAEPLPAQVAAAILALRTEATYAATELTGGRVRSAGAMAAIAGLLGMLSATRALDAGQPADPVTRRALDDAAQRLVGDQSPAPMDALPADPHAAMMLDRAHELLQQRIMVRAGLLQLQGGKGSDAPAHFPISRLPVSRLPVYRDWVGAGLSAARTVIAVGLGGWFCVVSGWPGTTLLLVQLSAFTALLGMQPNPTAAAVNIAIGLPAAALAAGVIGFVLLPQASGFVPFALALAPFAFVFGLAAQHPATARFGPGLMLYLTLLLSPANTESFDFAAFLNTVMIQVVALLFMILAFRLILPVSPSRRLFRVADSIGQAVRRALASRPDRHDRVAARSLRADRLAQAQMWLGRVTPSRRAVLTRLSAFSELTSALRRAEAGLHTLGQPVPQWEPRAMEAAAQGVLTRGNPSGENASWALQAAGGLHEAAILLQRHGRALRRYGIMDA